jgi:pseudouridine-5'-monophosphatase
MKYAIFDLDGIELEDLISSDELVHACINQAVTALFPTMKLMPGAEVLLRRLKARNIPIAIATSSASHTVRLKTVHHPGCCGNR